MSKEYVGDSRNDCFFSYSRNKSVWTLSQNLQISPDSKALELKLKITELKNKVLHVVL